MNTDLLLNASGARAGEANDSGAHRKPPSFSSLFSSRILLAFAGVLAFLTAPAVESQLSLQDTQPPTVAITSPAPSSTLKGTVTVGVSASDNVGVARVDLLVNGVRVASSTSAPYAFAWNSTTVPDGSVMLTATAYDAAGNASSTVVNEMVANAAIATLGSTSDLTLSVSSSNPASGVSIWVYPADTSGLSAGTSSLTRIYPPNTRVWLSAALRSGDNYFTKWQEDGVDYDTASTTSVVMDASHTFTAVYETPNCTGVSVSPGTDSIQGAAALYPAGTTFCIKAGLHRMTTTVIARTNDKYIGETGAILNGSKIVTSFVQSGGYWIATGQTQQEPPMQAANGVWPVCTSSAPACIYHERVFLDGQDLWQVPTLADLGPGRFYFDYANDNIYLIDNPTGHTVEATTGTGGIIGYSGGGSDSVTVKNLIFEKFGGGVVDLYAHNALKALDGWRVENNEFRYISSMAVANFGNGVVRNNYIHHNGQYGVIGRGTIEGNVLSFNNIDGFDTGNDAGASKFHGTNGLVLRGNVAANNNGRGLWADYDNINVTYENNILENNAQMGILHEASCAATISNNVLRGNNSLFAGKPIWWGGQIFAGRSKDLQIYGNDVTASAPGQNGIGANTDTINGVPETYTGPNCGTIDLQNIAVHDNVVRLDSGQEHGMYAGVTGYGATYNIQFSNNTYYLKDLGGNYFQYNGGPTTKAQWQAWGQDVTGQFYQLATLPTVTTTTDTSSLNPSAVGQNVIFTATVTGSAPTGSVAFTDGASTISGCGLVALPAGTTNSKTATCSTSLSAGTHVIVATYSGDAANTGSVSTTLSQVVMVNASTDLVWVNDSLPAGATAASDGGDGWNWVSSNPAPYSGTLAHQSTLGSGEHQHFFYGATATLSVAVGASLFAYVYLDAANPPSEVMLQWNDGTWEHRAYWGANLIAWGADGTVSRRYMGALPPAGQWVRLAVPAAQVGLEGRTLNGMAYTLYGGRATWDYAGKGTSTAQTATTTALTSSANPSLLGAGVTFTATVIGGAPTGSVAFTDSGIAVTGCGAVVLPTGTANSKTATCSIVNLTAGSHSIVANYSGDAANSGSTSVPVLQVVSSGTDVVWISDSVPTGAVTSSDGGDAWNWVSSNPAPYSGLLAHQSTLGSGEHQHYFYGATATLSVAVGESLFAYVYLDAANPPSELMLQWNDGTWEHRAYWGANLIAWGADGTVSRRYMGALPAAGQWVRLSVPAAQVGLEGHTLNGMAYTLYGGRATWDYAGKSASDVVWVNDSLPSGALAASDGGDAWNWVSSNPAPYSGTLAHQSTLGSGEHQHFFYGATATLSVAVGESLFAYVHLDAANPPSEVMLQWNDGTWEHRAYWGANLIAWGTDGTVSRRYMGVLPPAGQWVRLAVPAAQVGLEGRTLNGIAYTLYGGRATWDYAGKNTLGQ